jgi:hypothetical protein
MTRRSAELADRLPSRACGVGVWTRWTGVRALSLTSSCTMPDAPAPAPAAPADAPATAPAPARSRVSVPSVLVLAFMLFVLTNRGPGDELARGARLHALAQMGWQRGNYSDWLHFGNATDNFTLVRVVDAAAVRRALMDVCVAGDAPGDDAARPLVSRSQRHARPCGFVVPHERIGLLPGRRHRARSLRPARGRPVGRAGGRTRARAEREPRDGAPRDVELDSRGPRRAHRGRPDRAPRGRGRDRACACARQRALCMC